MVRLLEKAFDEVSKLPEDQQEVFTHWIDLPTNHFYSLLSYLPQSTNQIQTNL